MSRDFSKEKKEELYRALDTLDEREWKPFMVWCGRRADEFGEWTERLGISSYTKQIDHFQDRVLEINNSTRNQIDVVFEEVAEIDRRYAEIFREHAETVRKQISIVMQMMEYVYSGVKKVLAIKRYTEIQVKKEPASNSDGFIDSIRMAYGFAEEEAKTLKKLYSELENIYGDKASQMFFAIMASFSYGGVEDTKNAVLWWIIADIEPIQAFGYPVFEQYGITKDQYKHMKTEVTIQHMLCEMPQNSTAYDLKEHIGLNQILNELAEQTFGISFEDFPEHTKQAFYEYYLTYCNKADFTHMCATSATILNDGKLKGLGVFAGLFNGIYSVDGNAGYVGDVYGTNGKKPNMGNADYMADLDAVNISNRIINGKSAVEAITEYYAELDTGKTNRAREFKYNIGEEDGFAILYLEARQNYNFLNETEKNDDSRRDVVIRFLYSLYKEYNYLYEEENE